MQEAVNNQILLYCQSKRDALREHAAEVVRAGLRPSSALGHGGRSRFIAMNLKNVLKEF